ncbi:hypothetical protein WJX77_008859 [Trebouxia sp. C0004]
MHWGLSLSCDKRYGQQAVPCSANGEMTCQHLPSATVENGVVLRIAVRVSRVCKERLNIAKWVQGMLK